MVSAKAPGRSHGRSDLRLRQQAGEDNRNVARMAMLLAGLPDSVPGVTVNRLCGSGLEAVVQAARMVTLGRRGRRARGRGRVDDARAVVVAKAERGFPTASCRRRTTRASAGAIRTRSSSRALPARADGRDSRERARRSTTSRATIRTRSPSGSHAARGRCVGGRPLRDGDRARRDPAEEGRADSSSTRTKAPRADTTIEKLAKLKPVFRKGGTVTAGNSSTLNDGAACVLVASEKAVKESA